MRNHKKFQQNIESCIKLRQNVKHFNRTGRGVEFDAIPGAPVLLDGTQVHIVV